MVITTLGKVARRLNIRGTKFVSNKFISSIIKSTVPKLELTINNIDYAREILGNYSKKPTSSSVINKDRIYENINDLNIIIPAFNVENYIRDCIESILRQKTTFKYQIIIVNDGSTDDTAKILEEYSQNPKIKLIYQRNKGFSGSRNTALEHVNSKYIMFVDSDDKLYENSIQTLLSAAYKNDLDIVEGGYATFKDDKILQKYQHTNINSNKALGLIRGFPWGKVIKANIFSNIRYPENYWFEDTIFAYLVFPQTNKVATINSEIYLYRKNPNSISNTAKRKIKSIDTYWILELMLDDITKLEIDLNQDIYEHTLKQVVTNFLRTAELNEDIKQCIFLLTCQLMNDKFNDFNTNNKRLERLENSIKEVNYKDYYYSCSFV